MSFELEDSEEDISANLDGGHGTLDGGGLYPTGGSTPQQDEYDFDLEESTSRADSPVPPSPPSPQPPPVTMPPMRPVATGMAGKNRFKPQPEVMRRQQNPAYEDEAAAESGEGEEEEEEEEEGGDALYNSLDGGGGIYEPRGMMVQLGQQQHQQQYSFAAPPTSSYSPPRGGVEEELGESGGGGEVEEEYSSDMVEAISTSPAPGFLIPSTLPPALLAPGTRVWGLYRSGEEWFEGMVVAGNGDGTWVVSYGDDDEEEAVPLQRMRWVVEGGGVGGGGAPLPTSSSPAGEVIRDTSSPYSYTQDAFDEDVDSPTTSPRAQLPSLNVVDGGSPPGAAAAAAAAAVASPAYSTPGSYPPSPPLSSPLAKSTTGGAVGGTPGGFVGVTPLQQQQHSVPAPPFPIVSGGSGGSYLPPLPPGYTYAAVPLPSLSSASSSSSSAAHPPPPPPPPPSYPSVGGGFHGGLAGIALALAQASPLLNLGSSSLASVINAHFGGGVSPATLQEAMNLKGLGAGTGGNSASSSTATATAAAAAPPPPPPLQTPPTSAFLQALSAGLKLSGEGSNSSSTTTTTTYAPLHPAVAKALASAQATLATHDTLYARQLEALREVATRAKGRVQHMKERAGWGGGGMRPPGGGGGSPTSSPPLMVPAPPPVPSFKSTWRGPGEEGRVPGGLSFQEALAIVKREGVRRDAAAAVAAAAF